MRQTGSRIKPCLYFLTFMTSCACVSGEQLWWMMPMPPQSCKKQNNWALCSILYRSIDHSIVKILYKWRTIYKQDKNTDTTYPISFYSHSSTKRLFYSIILPYKDSKINTLHIYKLPNKYILPLQQPSLILWLCPWGKIPEELSNWSFLWELRSSPAEKRS